MTTRTVEKRRRVERITEAVTSAGPAPPRRTTPLGTRNRVELHLVTYVAGNLFFWMLWGAISISTDHWYWWPIVPMAAWTAVLVSHLWLAHRKVSR